MSERDTDYSIGTQNSAAPQSSGGADDSAPDTSKSTAEFRAFASQASDVEQPWNMKAPGRKIILLAVAVVVVAVVLAIVAIGVLNA
jgi:anti-sigma-K factor RskA